jgi:hypothetical protein
MAAEANNTFEQQTWYADSGANAHITANVANLTTLQPYDDLETVQVGNGSCLIIKNTGFSSLHTDHTSFQLNKVFHCPQATTNLLSINQLCLDNDCYFILTGIIFVLRRTRQTNYCSTGWLRMASIQSMGTRITSINSAVSLPS